MSLSGARNMKRIRGSLASHLGGSHTFTTVTVGELWSDSRTGVPEVVVIEVSN